MLTISESEILDHFPDVRLPTYPCSNLNYQLIWDKETVFILKDDKQLGSFLDSPFSFQILSVIRPDEVPELNVAT